MLKPIFIIKLGGSVITYKNCHTAKLRQKRLQEIAIEIKQAQKEIDFDLILVIGAGSFGHPLAHKYQTQNGVYNQDQAHGFCEIKTLMNKMVSQVAQILNQNGLSVFPCQTASLIVQDKGKISSFNTDPIKNLLKIGVIPLLSGDVSSDITLGGSICSGDAIVPYLTKTFKVEKIFFASDVDGIFDKDPKKNKTAQVIPIINSKNFSELINQIGISNNTDVTDGMKGKILKYKEEVNQTPAFVFNGLKKQSVFNAILGKQKGTILDLA